MHFDASSDPDQLWLYAERYLSAGTRSYSAFAGINEMDDIWRPGSATARFQVPCFWVERSKNAKFICESNQISPSLAKFYSPSASKFLLPVHPATIRLLPSKVQKQIKQLTLGPRLDVSPTSSTRTLYVHGADGPNECPHHFLKLHFPRRISRFIRSLTDEDVIYQLWISKQIQSARLPHFPDLAGGYALRHQKSSAGFLIRATQQEGGVDGSCFTLPGFSLFGGDTNSLTDPPLMVQLHRHFGGSAADFVVKRIIAPTVDLWVKAVSKLGIVPELHGQNVLFCFNKCGSDSSICFRDSDLLVDNRIRRQLGFDNPPFLTGVTDYDCDCTSERYLSLCYDGFLVHHFLAKVAACAEDWFHIPVCLFRDAATCAFHAAGGNALPISDAAFYFDNQLRTGKQFVLVKQPSFELWR